MGSLQPKELSKLGFTDNITRSLIINIISKNYKHHSKPEISEVLLALKNDPRSYAADPVLGKIARSLFSDEKETVFRSYELLTATGALKVYGSKEIEYSAKQQMETAMSLPITIQGALMPDAHAGYGLPIGGVLATDNAVVPYAVGVDIGCRMALSIIPESARFFKSHAYQMKQALRDCTHFGMEGSLEFERDHEVLERSTFREIALLKPLHGKAARQLGSSGGGNHFVEFGVVHLEADNAMGLVGGEYIGLLSHSGSRALGANIAQHYTKLAMGSCRLPRSAQQLAWLDINSEAGQEYWISMNLAGDYARACHETIHHHVLKNLGIEPIALIENHHNFAWKDQLPDGREVIVHRKGATPAHSNELGIIPGTMASPAFLIRGKGAADALFSASHGAGRAMSRKRAAESMTVSAMKKMLAEADVTLIGGSVEENPTAYKDIRKVIAAQDSLVDIIGTFQPKIVRMNKD